MAHRPGRCDLRCPEAVQSAFLLHSEFGSLPGAIAAGVQMVQSGNWAFAQYLPPSDARRALNHCLPEIVRAQQKTGMWFRKHSEPYTYPILKALAHAELLPELIERAVLRHDPFQRFAQAADEWGFLVRKNIMQKPLADDKALRVQLVAAQSKPQNADGSWGHTVSETALTVEHLLELGVPLSDARLTRAAQWLLSQFQNHIERGRAGSSLALAVQDLFTSSNRSAEHAGASRLLQGHKLACSCFGLTPFVQTGLALRALVRLGYEQDEKVRRAFASLLDLQTKRQEPLLTLPPVPVGGWCVHVCKFKVAARAKANRPRPSPAGTRIRPAKPASS